ncbi:Adrenodoxin-like protein [Drosera capensis]
MIIEFYIKVPRTQEGTARDLTKLPTSNPVFADEGLLSYSPNRPIFFLHLSCPLPAPISHQIEGFGSLVLVTQGKIMIVSRLSRLGSRLFTYTTKGQSTYNPRKLYLHATDGRFQYSGCRQRFFTTAAAEASKEGNEEKTMINVTFVLTDGEEKHIKVPVGTSMLEAAHENDIELEGACEGSLACSTCHVIVTDAEFYNKLEDPTDEENDMLDLAFGLTELSRLGCQVIAKPELDGIRLALPAATRNFSVDGYKPKPH